MPASAPPPTPSVAALSVPWLAGLVVAIALLEWITPGYEAAGVMVPPLVPALALAVGAAALAGWRALPPVALGAAIGAIGFPPAVPGAQEVLGALVLVAQAAFGGMLLRRSGRPDDLALDNRAALRRLVVAALACGVIGGVAQVLGDLAWSADPSLRPFTLAVVHTIADAASIVMLMPVLMAFAAPQRSRWEARRRSVAAPLAVAVVLMLVAFVLVHERDRQQAVQRFERDADVVFARTQGLLDAPILALQALQGVFEAAGAPLAAHQFESLARPWIKRAPGLIGLGSFEFAAAGEADAPTAGGQGSATSRAQAADGRAAPTLRHLLGTLPMLPAAASAPAATVLSLPAAMQAARQAAAQATPIGSTPIGLGAGPDARPGVVLMQGLPGHAKSAQQAVAFAVLSPETLIVPITAARGDALRVCLFDADARIDPRRLAGPSGCDSTPPGEELLSRETTFDYAGRQWTMRTTQPVRTTGGVWLFAIPALAGGALLALMLAGVTGRVQRVSEQARSRTDELRHELDQRAQTQSTTERTVQAMLDAVQAGMALIDATGRIRHANEAFAGLIGSTPAKLQHQLIDDVLVDSERPAPGRFARLIADAGDQLVNLPIQLRAAGASAMPALITLRVLRDELGRPSSAVCAVHDLSENLRRRQVEQVLGKVLHLTGGETVPGVLAPTAEADDQRVLCISAGAGLLEELRTALHDRPRIQVDGATGAEEGLETARSRRTDLVLLDLDLPGADSLALVRTLTAERMRVVALSRDLRPERIDAAFAAGARAYLTLPPEPRELLAVIDDVL